MSATLSRLTVRKIDHTGPKLQRQILASLDLNRERTMEGLKAALARDQKGGRPRRLSEDDLAATLVLLREVAIPVADIARRFSISRTAFYRYFPAAHARSRTEAG